MRISKTFLSNNITVISQVNMALLHSDEDNDIIEFENFFDNSVIYYNKKLEYAFICTHIDKLDVSMLLMYQSRYYIKQSKFYELLYGKYGEVVNNFF